MERREGQVVHKALLWIFILVFSIAWGLSAALADDGGASLSGLSIAGPESVYENTSAVYTATASFRDGSSREVTTSATWSENSSYASISRGTLTARSVSSDQSLTITARYSSNGTTRTATKAVSILNGSPSSPPPPATGGGSHANRFSSYEGTKTCLACHRTQALAVYASEHYQWKGKLGAINDFCIYPDVNHIGRLTNVNGIEVDAGCGRCHIGLGEKPVAASSPTDAQLENIDCLICHAPKYKRTVDPVSKAKFIPDEAKMGMTIYEAAVDIQKTSRGTCLNCHTKSGGGDNFKRGDIEEHHRAPTSRAFDVHMSPASLDGGDMHCTRCHTVTNHKIAGRGTDLRIQEGTKPECTSCHTATPPHRNSNINARHLGRVHCTVCHIPTFAKNAPTDMFRDWPGTPELNTVTGLYDPARDMRSNVTPQYRFWDGKNTTFYQFGTRATPGANGFVSMAAPVGSITTSGAKIYAFKYHTATQPIDTVTRFLLPLKIGYFYTTGDLDAAIKYGQTAVGWAQNPYEYQDTERWMGLFHEVSPKESALGYNNACNTCHGTTNPKVPLKTLGYTAKKPTSDLCNDCHELESYSFNAVHPRHANEGYDCSVCHSFSKAQ